MNNCFTKILILILVSLLISCGGGGETSTPKPIPIVKSSIDNIYLDHQLTRDTESTVNIECTKCDLESVVYQWKVDDTIVSDTNKFTPKLEHINKDVSILVNVNGTNGASNALNTKTFSVLPRETTISNISINDVLVRGQESVAVIECVDCIKEQAIFRWEVDGTIVSNKYSFTPDFEHLDKTIFVYASVPSIDFKLSDEVNTSSHLIPRETEITAINVRADLILGQSTIAEIDCEGCVKNEASFIWRIEDDVVSTSNEFIPNEQSYSKKIEITVTVPSIDRVISEPKRAQFKRRFVTKVFSNTFMDVFLMNDGELVWRSPYIYSAHSWPTESENDFIDFKSATARWGNVLALDENGKYHEYGDDFLLRFGVSTTFEDIENQLGTVVEYWIDGAGHHALNQDNQVISWNVQENGQREHFELTKAKVENVKQVVSSIVNSGYTDAATAVLFSNGNLVIDAFVDPNFTYQRFTRTNIKKIQGIQLSNEPHSDVEYLAIFDHQDNVEIWSVRWGNQSYRNVDKILSKNDESSYLVIKKDGSYTHSGNPDNDVILNGSARATDLVQTRPGASWAVLTNDGTPVDISSGSVLDDDLLSPEFLLRDIAYSHSIRNSNSFALVKTTGEAFLSTQENYTIINQVKNIHTPDNYFLVVDGSNRLDSYFQRDSNRKIDPDGFSNGLGYVENVITFFPLHTGVLTLDEKDYPTLVDTRDTVFGDAFIEKLVPKATKLFFGAVEEE